MTILVPERVAASELAKAGEGFAVAARPDVLAGRVLAAGAAAMAAALFAVWSIGIVREPGLGECRVTPASLASVSPVSATIRMRGNMACAIPIALGAAGAFQIRIPPEHGSVMLDVDRVSYRPAPRFKGRDFFVVAIRDRASRFDGAAIARIHVFVK
jgi:hypothetical protein